MIHDKFLTAVVSISPTEQELTQLDTLLPEISNWENTLRLLTQHGSAPLLYTKLPKLHNAHCIPSKIQAQLQQVYYHTLSRNMLLYNTFTEAAITLQQANIQVVALKGIYLSATLYNDIALRQLSDIDLLVPEKDGERAVKLLQSIGFVPHDPSVSAFISSQTEIVHYPPLVRNGVSIEVHIRLHRKNKAYAIDTAYMLANTIQWEYKSLKLEALDTYNSLVHLLIHIDKHFEGGEIQMKCFNDIVNLIRLQGDNFNWKTLETCSKIHACEALVFKYLLLTATFYDIRLNKDIQTKYASTQTADLHHQFVKFLHCEYEKKYHVGTHLHNIQHINSHWRKIRYFVELIFPPKSFMIEKYGLQHLKWANTWWLWYGHRWVTAIRALKSF